MCEEPRRPTTPVDRDGWNAYWTALGMPWRTEPEIAGERQRYLAERRAIEPDIEEGIYPFRDENGGIRLNRADVEWLLATHEAGRGPLRTGEWGRAGVDLRGAVLCGVDLSSLPLAGILGGLDEQLWHEQTPEQLRRAPDAAAHLEGADLSHAQLWWAMLDGAHLEGADLRRASLSGATLRRAHLEGASLVLAGLEANFYQAHLHGKRMGTDGLARVRQLLPDFPEVLFPADLRYAFFRVGTHLLGAEFGNAEYGGVTLADVRWGGANLAGVDWARVRMLGDERAAREWKPNDDDAARWKALPRKEARAKVRAGRRAAFEAAVRANRQLATTLRDQGLNEHADHFGYRAQVLQRIVLRLQRQRFRTALSWFLDALAGHGYKPERSLIAYLLAIVGFALAYFALGRTVGPHLSPLGAFVFSMTSFHGRGFFPGGIGLDDPITVLAAFEAFTGLVIEVSFIATFTQRFFAR